MALPPLYILSHGALWQGSLIPEEVNQPATNSKRSSGFQMIINTKEVNNRFNFFIDEILVFKMSLIRKQ